MFEKIKDFFKRDETKPGEDSQVSNISEIKEEKKSNDKNFKEVISSVFNKRNRKRWAVGDGERRKRRLKKKVKSTIIVSLFCFLAVCGIYKNVTGVKATNFAPKVVNIGGPITLEGNYNVSVWRSGNTVYCKVHVYVAAPHGAWQSMGAQVSTNKGSASKTLVGSGSAAPKAGSGDVQFSFNDGGSGTISGTIYAGFMSNLNGSQALTATFSVSYSSNKPNSGYSPSARQHNVNYDLNNGSWGTRTTTNGNIIIPNGIYSVQHLYSKQQGKNYYMHLLSPEEVGVHTWETDSNDNSNWYFERYKDTEYYYIFNKGTGLALSASGQDDNFQKDLSSTGDSTKLWRLKDKGNGTVRIINKNTGKCVFANYRTIRNGNPILQYAADDGIGSDGTWILNLKDSNAYHKKVEYIHFYVVSSTPTRTGYKFSGWNTKRDGSGTSYSSGAAYTPDQSGGSVTLYAQWIPDVQYVDVNGEYEGEKRFHIGDFGYITKVNGTSYGDSSHSDYYNTHQCGSTVSVTAKTWNGYEFTDGSTEKTITDTVPFNNRLEVLFKGRRKTYKVFYNSNGGTGTMNEQRIKYKDSFITNKNAFSKVGYRFAGYNEKADGTGTWWNIPGWSNGVQTLGAPGSNGMYETGKSWTWNYTNNITLYAQWAANEYTISYNVNGGKGNVNIAMATYDKDIQLDNGSGLSYEGFKFAGWNTKADGSGQQFDIGVPARNLTAIHTANVTLYAQWKESFSRDICEANPGMDAQEFEYTDKNYDVDRYNEIEKNLHSATDNMPSEGMHRVGYKIIGWNTDKKKAQDGIVEYKDKAEFINKSKENNSKVNLYAVWQIAEQTITYDLNGATETALASDTGKVANTIENNTQKYTYRTTTYISSGKSTTGKVITRPGYKFVGWETVPQVKG